MIFFKPHVTPDSFFHETSPASSLRPSPSWPITIYFITGNPGLISYYHAFLSLLGKKIVPGQDKFHIIGHSLAGFELEPGNAAAQNETQKQKQKHVKDPQLEHEHEHYYDVEEQICFVQGRLEAYMRALRANSAGTTTPTTDTTRSSSLATSSEKQRQSPRPKVILIGHSVGTYMTMEILRRHRERQETAASENNDFDIIGGVMLFPTVMDIASSPAGQKLIFLLRLIPQLPLVVSFFARILTAVLPTPIIRTLVKFVMHSPPDAAVDATVSFLKSKQGVRQALHMGADEMRTITTDKWSDDVWGVSRAPEPQSQPQLLTRLFFYFGRNDHWVAEQTREEIVAVRGATTKAGPRMIVCEESLPHAFCLKHNETMAHKVADMIREILE